MSMRNLNPQWGNEAFALKYKQIDSLRQYFPTLKEITKDLLYEIPVVLPSRKTLTLRIALLREFPYQPPTLQLFPPVIHKYVNQQQYLLPQIHEKLMQWNVHTSLGKMVYEVVQKLMQDPPQIAGTSSSQSSGMSYGFSGQAAEPPPPYGSVAAAQPAHTPIPPIPDNFAELDSKSAQQLTDLLSDEDKFKQFFGNLDGVNTMRQLRDDLRVGNADIKTRQAAREQEIENLRRLLSEKKAATAQTRAALDQKAQRQQLVMNQFSTLSLIEKLGDSAALADSESEQVALSFLDGASMDHKEFIKKFMEKRRVYHLRAAKKESLTMTLNR